MQELGDILLNFWSQIGVQILDLKLEDIVPLYLLAKKYDPKEKFGVLKKAKILFSKVRILLFF